MMDWHRFTITSPEKVGNQAIFEIDGQRLKGVRRVTLNVGVNEPNVVIVEMFAASINADVKVEEVIEDNGRYTPEGEFIHFLDCAYGGQDHIGRTCQRP